MSDDLHSAILARLDAMDRARDLEREVAKEWREGIGRQLDEIVTQVRATNGRVTRLEKDEIKAEGERLGRSAVFRVAALAAGAAAAATGIAFQIVDHWH